MWKIVAGHDVVTCPPLKRSTLILSQAGFFRTAAAPAPGFAEYTRLGFYNLNEKDGGRRCSDNQ